MFWFFQDYLTKLPLVYVMPDQHTERSVKILVEEIVLNFGVPESLLSDRGTNLLSHLMPASRYSQVEHHNISPPGGWTCGKV